MPRRPEPHTCLPPLGQIAGLRLRAKTTEVVEGADALAELLGLDPAGAAGSLWRERISPLDAGRAGWWLGASADAARRMRFTARFITADGGLCTAIIDTRPRGPRPCAELDLVITACGETNRHGLREANWDLLSALADASNGMLFHLSREGLYLAVEPSGHSGMVRPADTLLGQNIAEFLPREVDTAYRQAINAALDDGESRRIDYGFEVRGEWRDFTALIVPCGTDEVFAFVRDETEERRERRELERSERGMRQLINSLPIVTFSIDANGVFLISEGLGLGEVGYSPGEAVGKSLYDMAKDNPAVLRMFRRALSGETFVERQEFRGRTHDTWWMPTRRPDGKVTGVSGIAVDVTSRVQFEHERRRVQDKLRQIGDLERLERVTASFAHDLNVFLLPVLTGTEYLLGEEPTGRRLRRGLETVQASARKCAEITGRLAGFSLRRQTQPEHVDIAARLHSLGTVLRGFFHRDEALAIEAPTPGPLVLVDPYHFDQLVVNLVSNASDSIDPETGVVTVTVTTGHDGAGNPRARLAVADNGRGMPEEVRRHVFDPFYSTGGDGRHMGLGLSLVWDTARSAGGSVDVESAVGEGATFRVDFPASAANATHQVAVENARSGAPPHAGQRRHVLLVSPDPIHRALTASLLRRRNFVVYEAESAVRAVERIRREGHIDAVVTELDLGGHSGVALARDILNSVAAAGIVITSAHEFGPADRDFARGRPVELLAKPYDNRELVDAIRRVQQRAPEDWDG